MSIDHLYNQTFTLRSTTPGVDAYGTPTETYSNTSTFRGRLQKLRGKEIMWSDKETIFSDCVLYCDSAIAIAANSQLTYDSRTFKVRSFDDENQMSHHQKVLLLEIV